MKWYIGTANLHPCYCNDPSVPRKWYGHDTRDTHRITHTASAQELPNVGSMRYCKPCCGQPFATRASMITTPGRRFHGRNASTWA